MRRFFQKWKGSFKNRNTIRGSFENEQVLSKAIVFASTLGGSFENTRVLSKIEGFFRNILHPPPADSRPLNRDTYG